MSKAGISIVEESQMISCFSFGLERGKSLDMTVCGEFIHLSNYCWGDAMAEEKLFEGQIKKYFHSVGIYPAGYPTDRMNAPMVGWYTKIWGGGFQKSGIPDIICCVNGVMLAVEVKASNGRPSELQKLNISRINKSGGVAVFLYPEGFEQFKELLKGVINCGIHIPALIALKSANTSTKCVTYTGYPPFPRLNLIMP